MAGQVLLALSTFPDAETAQKVVTKLSMRGSRLAATSFQQIESIYRWQGKVERNPEVLVIFKMTEDRYAEFEKKLRSLHPYEVPEIICANITRGLPDYLRWVAESCAD